MKQGTSYVIEIVDGKPVRTKPQTYYYEDIVEEPQWYEPLSDYQPINTIREVPDRKDYGAYYE